ncbi:carboxymuconolactone decarboxylase family protein [Bordetella sp. 2513F-2]
MPRIDMPAPASLSAEQRQAWTEVVAGPRGKAPAPMIAWICNPELARRSQRLGELLRFETTLGPRLTELAILVCARHWTSHHEWTAHKALALAAGLDAGAIADIAARRQPQCDDPEALLVYRVSHTLLSTGAVPPDLYSECVASLGERGVVELVAVLGYYCYVALTLNTFELGLPDNFAPELA